MNFGIREICNVVLRPTASMTFGSRTIAAGEPFIYFETLKASTLAGTADTTYATGGRGNAQLIAWEGNKTVTFSMEDALVSPESFAILNGASVTSYDGSATKVKRHRKDVVAVPSAAAYSLSGIPVGTGTFPTYIFATDGTGSSLVTKLILTTDYTIATNQLTITAGGLAKITPAGGYIVADFYEDSLVAATRFTITSSSFAGYYTLEGETLMRRQDTGADLPAIFTIPKGKIKSNFEFSMTPDGEPSTFTFEMDAFPSNAAKTLYTLDMIGSVN